jgi:hypothetical protein
MNRKLFDSIKKCAVKANVSIEKIEQTQRHIKVLVRGNKPGVVFVSLSASDYRVFKNVVSDMKKEGYANV